MDEKLRIRKVLSGDSSAFGYFVDTYQDMAITIAYRVCGNMQDAEDIVQNAFVRTFHNLHTFKFESKFSTWFYRIVYNTAITETKNPVHPVQYVDYNQMDMQDTYSDLDTIRQMEEKERIELVNEALGKMSKEANVLLSLFYLEEQSVKDVSKITGLTESNVKVKLHRARKQLAGMLTQLMIL
jgi:RNA polymerase sigma-70 factor (ECF subfamily)